MLTCILTTFIADDVTVYLSMKAFENPSDYYSLDNMDAETVQQIERYLQGGSINNLNIEVNSQLKVTRYTSLKIRRP